MDFSQEHKKYLANKHKGGVNNLNGNSFENIYATKEIVRLFAERPDLDNTFVACQISNAFVNIGRELGHVLRSKLPPDFRTSTLLACASEDADWLATGVLEGLKAPELPMAVFWSKRYALESGVDIAPIIMSYQDDISADDCKTIIVVKSIISSSCVVKTQLLRLISTLSPERIFIVAPVMLSGAEQRLANEFPKVISDKFYFITFAIDDELKGKEIVPGIGGMVYDRLGLVNESEKNRYIPRIVNERMALGS